ncbi:MAG: DinB family protein [Planctomycetota bacterium]
MTQATIRPSSDTIPAAGAMLAQVRTLVDHLSDEQYTAPSEAMFGATVGAHVRHSLDHFRAALAGLEGETVDYDHRDRDTDVEASTAGAIAEIDALQGAIDAMDPGDADREVTIRVMLSGDGCCCDLSTTLGRELAFAAHHNVHHNAMIKAICAELGVSTPDGFGKAPSTINHESDHDQSRG